RPDRLEGQRAHPAGAGRGSRRPDGSARRAGRRPRARVRRAAPIADGALPARRQRNRACRRSIRTRRERERLGQPGRRRGMNNWAAIRLVAGREINTRVRSRAFRITSGIMVAVVVGFVLVLKLLGQQDSGSKVAFTPSAAPLSAPFQSVATAVGQTVTTSTVD